MRPVTSFASRRGLGGPLLAFVSAQPCPRTPTMAAPTDSGFSPILLTLPSLTPSLALEVRSASYDVLYVPPPTPAIDPARRSNSP